MSAAPCRELPLPPARGPLRWFPDERSARAYIVWHEARRPYWLLVRFNAWSVLDLAWDASIPEAVQSKDPLGRPASDLSHRYGWLGAYYDVVPRQDVPERLLGVNEVVCCSGAQRSRCVVGRRGYAG